jgi:hypothetical protein
MEPKPVDHWRDYQWGEKRINARMLTSGARKLRMNA